MSTTSRCAWALLAGVVLSGSFEPIALPWLLVPSVAVLFWLTHRATWRPALLAGWAYGAGFMFTHQVWMRAIGPDAWIAISLLETSFFGLLAVAVSLTRNTALWPVFAAGWWVVIEEWRIRWPFGGMPWGRLSYGVMDTPVASWLPWLGASGVSLQLALCAGIAAWWLDLGADRVTGRPADRSLIGQSLPAGQRLVIISAASMIAAICLVLPLPVDAPASERGRLDVAVVQGQVPGDGTDVLLDHRAITRTLRDRTVALATEPERPDLVVWPENSTAIDPFANADVNGWINEAVTAVDRPVLVGAMVNGPDARRQVLNQGIVWLPGSGAGDRYTKRHPVPYGEFIPYREQLPFQSTFGKLRLIPRDLMRGTRVVPLRVPVGERTIPVADAICFDVGYDEGGYAQLRQGAELLVVQTSNAMFVHTAQIRQQFEISRVRAAEAGKYLVVASMNGVTGVVGPDGEVLQEAPPLDATVLRAQVSLLAGTPWSVWTGPAARWVASALALTGLVLAAYRRQNVGKRRTHAQKASGPTSAHQLEEELS